MSAKCLDWIKDMDLKKKKKKKKKHYHVMYLSCVICINMSKKSVEAQHRQLRNYKITHSPDGVCDIILQSVLWNGHIAKELEI